MSEESPLTLFQNLGVYAKEQVDFMKNHGHGAPHRRAGADVLEMGIVQIQHIIDTQALIAFAGSLSSLPESHES